MSADAGTGGDKPKTQPNGKAWLIAAWPGMGSVAVMAAGYLVQQLGLQELGDLPSRDHFDINDITVKDGLIQPTRLPRGVFFRRDGFPGGRSLIVFLGEAQPSKGVYAYAHELMVSAKSMGVERVVTFASMASGLHPADNPKVFGVATNPVILEELRRAEVEPLGDGEIGGLNGVVLATAAESDIPGFGLLAEIPFFAAAVPNPKAARVALSVFSVLSGIEVSLEELDQHAEAVDHALIEAYNRMQAEKSESSGAEDETGDEGDESEESGGAPLPEAPPQPEPSTPSGPKLDFATRQRIEQMFEDARRDTSKAMALKQELDRLGVFKRYEDRFLDLFRRAQ